MFFWTKLKTENARLQTELSSTIEAWEGRCAEVLQLQAELQGANRAVDNLKEEYDYAIGACRNSKESVDQLKAEQAFLQESIAHAKKLVKAELLGSLRARPLQAALIYTLETIIGNIGEPLPSTKN